jgi:pyrimidine operon attenuation protein/uracil phosphoribosyltransferase
MQELLNDKQVARAVSRLYQQVSKSLPREVKLAVVGMRSRGDLLADRLAERLKADRPGQSIERGVLDITFYRDDLSRRKGMPLVRATQINFDLDDRLVLLVDDVLATGRSIRAALGALADFGRPSAIRLAVLIDRGGRELPIAPDFVGDKLDVPAQDVVQVCLLEADGKDAVLLLPAAKPGKKK